MKEITLANTCKTALVDDEDYDMVSKYRWFLLVKKTTNYAKAFTPRKNGKRTSIYMHRLILGLTDPKQVGEHKDGNGLNNQRLSNLRVANQSQNCANRKVYLKNYSSKYKGVSWSKKHKSWMVSVCKNYKAKYIGRFKNEVDAAIAYNNAAKELHGDFARLNKITLTS